MVSNPTLHFLVAKCASLIHKWGDVWSGPLSPQWANAAINFSPLFFVVEEVFLKTLANSWQHLLASVLYPPTPTPFAHNITMQIMAYLCYIMQRWCNGKLKVRQSLDAVIMEPCARFFLHFSYFEILLTIFFLWSPVNLKVALALSVHSKCAAHHLKRRAES